jgi:ABC-type branched-subunit amino acid transport system ATPase component
METTSKQLVLENISKHFGSLVAVQDVNLVIEPGELLDLSNRQRGMSFMIAALSIMSFRKKGTLELYFNHMPCFPI